METHDDSGEVFTDNIGIGGAFISYFPNLFTCTSVGDVTTILNTITCSISRDEKLQLGRPYTIIDVKAALDTMFLEKAPVPDGMMLSARITSLFLVMIFSWWFLKF